MCHRCLKCSARASAPGFVVRYVGTVVRIGFLFFSAEYSSIRPVLSRTYPCESIVLHLVFQHRLSTDKRMHRTFCTALHQVLRQSRDASKGDGG